jgi:hypothetical protein
MIKYDENYYYNLLKIQASTARDVMTKRYTFIMDNIDFRSEEDEQLTLLDYGCGIGAMKSFAPGGWDVDTFDIMPVPQTGIKRQRYDVITMYDVLEHIPDFKEVEPILKKGDYVVISVPVKPPDVPWQGYKHFKPSEHLHYFTDDLLEHMFKHMGFKLIAKGMPECPPREYINSYIFKNEKA